MEGIHETVHAQAVVHLIVGEGAVGQIILFSAEGVVAGLMHLQEHIAGAHAVRHTGGNKVHTTYMNRDLVHTFEHGGDVLLVK